MQLSITRARAQSGHFESRGDKGVHRGLWKRLDIEGAEFWSKAYLPPERTIETPGAFEGKLIFDHVQIKVISTREPLLGCGPLPDWLRKKGCIYALDGTEEETDNLCMWRCLAVHFRGDKKMREKFGTREALNLAREYYAVSYTHLTLPTNREV